MTTMFFIAGATAAVIGIETITAKLMGARWLALLVVPIANIISLIAGLYLAGGLFYLVEPMFGTHLVDTAAPAAWTTLAVLAVFGVLIEWPMFRLCFRGERPWKRSLFALLVGAGLSNLLLVVMAYNTYDHGLALNFKRTSIAEIVTELEGPLPWVYYIDGDGDAVSRIRLDGTNHEQVCEINYRQGLPEWQQPGLDLRVVQYDQDRRLELLYSPFVTAWESADHRESTLETPAPQPIAVDFPIGDASEWHGDGLLPRLDGFADLRAEGEREDKITIWFGGVAHYGQHSLKVFNPMVGHDLEASALTALPDGLAVFDFARYAVNDPPRGIMLISTKTMRRALLVEDGWCPVVVYERQD